MSARGATLGASSAKRMIAKAAPNPASDSPTLAIEDFVRFAFEVERMFDPLYSGIRRPCVPSTFNVVRWDKPPMRLSYAAIVDLLSLVLNALLLVVAGFPRYPGAVRLQNLLVATNLTISIGNSWGKCRVPLRCACVHDFAESKIRA